MPSFLDKLQKGMETDEESLQEVMEEKTQEPKAELTSAKKKTKKKKTTKKERPKKKSIKVEKEKSEKKKENKEVDKGWFESAGKLTIDLYETDEDIIVRSAIAGVKPEDLDIVFEDDMIIIKGKREEEEEEKGKNYFYQECYWGYFSREVILPKEVDSSRAKASIKEGVLTIKIPKIEEEKKRKIKVKSEDEE